MALSFFRIKKVVFLLSLCFLYVSSVSALPTPKTEDHGEKFLKEPKGIAKVIKARDVTEDEISKSMDNYKDSQRVFIMDHNELKDYAKELLAFSNTDPVYQKNVDVLKRIAQARYDSIVMNDEKDQEQKLIDFVNFLYYTSEDLKPELKK